MLFARCCARGPSGSGPHQAAGHGAERLDARDQGRLVEVEAAVVEAVGPAQVIEITGLAALGADPLGEVGVVFTGRRAVLLPPNRDAGLGQRFHQQIGQGRAVGSPGRRAPRR